MLDTDLSVKIIRVIKDNGPLTFADLRINFQCVNSRILLQYLDSAVDEGSVIKNVYELPTGATLIYYTARKVARSQRKTFG